MTDKAQKLLWESYIKEASFPDLSDTHYSGDESVHDMAKIEPQENSPSWSATELVDNQPLEKLKRDVIEVIEDLAEDHDFDDESGGYTRSQLEAVEEIRVEINKTLDEYEDKLHIDPS